MMFITGRNIELSIGYFVVKARCAAFFVELLQSTGRSMLDSWFFHIINRPRSVQAFQTLCRLLGVISRPTTALPQPANGQSKRYNKTVDTLLCHYVAEH